MLHFRDADLLPRNSVASDHRPAREADQRHTIMLESRPQTANNLTKQHVRQQNAATMACRVVHGIERAGRAVRRDDAGEPERLRTNRALLVLHVATDGSKSRGRRNQRVPSPPARPPSRRSVIRPQQTPTDAKDGSRVPARSKDANAAGKMAIASI